ncbi:MAG: transglycosylase domain-containing protein, partial [Candidatus Latescibacteria bacterium]|nr:transglycosylase domain-containing protein [Candidatus Latescibacterota bacterium]
MRRLHLLVYVSVSLFGLTIVAGLVEVFVIAPTVPQLPDRLDDVFIGQPTQIYATGTAGEPTLIGTFGGRLRVSLDQVSPLFLRALIAVEDRHFYRHHGLDKLALLRSVWVDLRSWSKAQGGSTITQQLAKNLVLSPEKWWLRKAKELLIAAQIEQAFSKGQILEAYCNNVYFGAGAYGIESAAQAYFGKHASELVLAESAFLAGLLQNPSRYDAYQSFDRAKRRQTVVLDQMVRAGFIRSEERDAAVRAPLTLRRLTTGQDGPYFLDYVKKAAVEAYGNDLVYYGGLKIYTTIDLELQRHAQEAVQAGLARLDAAMGRRPGDGVQVALVAIEPQTGAIKAMVGGRSFATSPYNRAVQSNRLPGSGFKPFVYFTAIDRGAVTPATVVVDEPTTFPVSGGASWTPRNVDRTHHGAMTVKWALMQSINVAAAKLIAQIGPEAVVETATRFGITRPLRPHLSLALGTSGVSPLEMASAFGTFAADGLYAQPMGIG